ncbi:hypothetical protein EDD98_1781 [Streptomyces sp. PanSC19]|nr:hypothetical protein EDD98_1781 [Streptomyces sp. PanSC19]
MVGRRGGDRGRSRVPPRPHGGATLGTRGHRPACAGAPSCPHGPPSRPTGPPSCPRGSPLAPPARGRLPPRAWGPPAPPPWGQAGPGRRGDDAPLPVRGPSAASRVGPRPAGRCSHPPPVWAIVPLGRDGWAHGTAPFSGASAFRAWARTPCAAHRWWTFRRGSLGRRQGAGPLCPPVPPQRNDCPQRGGRGHCPGGRSPQRGGGAPPRWAQPATGCEGRAPGRSGVGQVGQDGDRIDQISSSCRAPRYA